jgi:hypothetical protein
LTTALLGPAHRSILGVFVSKGQIACVVQGLVVQGLLVQRHLSKPCGAYPHLWRKASKARQP